MNNFMLKKVINGITIYMTSLVSIININLQILLEMENFILLMTKKIMYKYGK